MMGELRGDVEFHSRGPLKNPTLQGSETILGKIKLVLSQMWSPPGQALFASAFPGMLKSALQKYGPCSGSFVHCKIWLRVAEVHHSPPRPPLLGPELFQV